MGSTGSVGTQTLKVIRNLNEHNRKFQVVCLTANQNYKLLSQQINEFKPEVCHILNNSNMMNECLEQPCQILTNKSELLELCKGLDYDILVMAISGCDGIEPTLEAAKSGRRIALSNKESVVSAGNLLKQIVKDNKTVVIPVDSEHNALFQCLDDATSHFNPDSIVNISPKILDKVKNLILTSSGGPFKGVKFTEYKNLKSSDAIKHPVWSMGSKITVDSSTMMNKALEVLEAHYLFGIPVDKIKILVHRECIVHSLVEFVDSSVLSQLYLPDMMLPISYSLCWPERSCNNLPQLDLTNYKLTFDPPDFENFPFLKLSYEIGKMGGLYPTVLNAANDMANELFRRNLIDYGQLHYLVFETIHQFNPSNLQDNKIEDILYVDSWAKRNVRELFESTQV